MIYMKKILLYGLITTTLYSYTLEDLKVFNTPLSMKEAKAVKKKDCWWICKKKLSRAQKIQKAIDFYKNSYNFSTKNLSR